MSKSSWKPVYIDNQIKLQKDLEVRYIYNRSSVIDKNMLGMKIYIYNGFRFYSIIVSSDMIGHKLGEFSPTRKKPTLKKKSSKKTSKKK